MNHIAILERAFQTTLRHRALWVLGFLWALVGGCGGGGSNGGGGGDGNLQFDDGKAMDMPPQLERFFGSTLELREILPIILGLVAVLFVLFLVSTVVRYVLQAGILRSLDQLHVDGVVPRVRRAFREGWNRRTWRLWIQNLIVDIPLVIVAILSLVVVALPVILILIGIADGGGPPVAAIILLIGLFMAWLLVMIAVGAVVGVLKQLWWRAAVVDDIGLLQAIGRGWQLARRNVADVAIMWLLMVGAGLVYFVIFLVLIVLFALVTGGVAVLPAFLLWESGREVLAFIYGLPMGFLTFFVPLLVAGGLYLIFEADVWTQVYRELTDRAEPAA